MKQSSSSTAISTIVKATLAFLLVSCLHWLTTTLVDIWRESDGWKYPWPISASQVIPFPASDVWQLITTPESVEWVSPYVASNPPVKWGDNGNNGHGQIDYVVYLNGLAVKRRITNWIPGIGYDLLIGQLDDDGNMKPDYLGADGEFAVVSWRIQPIDDNSCIFSITSHSFPLLYTYPPLTRWIPYLLGMRPMMKQYMNGVVRGHHYYMTHGGNEKVPKNYWGIHPWFSIDHPDWFIDGNQSNTTTLIFDHGNEGGRKISDEL